MEVKVSQSGTIQINWSKGAIIQINEIEGT